jgi:hypothetical protein
VSSQCPICGNPMPDDPFCAHCGFPLNLPDGQRRRIRRRGTPRKTSDYILGVVHRSCAGFPHPVSVDQVVATAHGHPPATVARTTGSTHAASSFFTRFTRLLTSYRRINAGLNSSAASSLCQCHPLRVLQQLRVWVARHKTNFPSRCSVVVTFVH